MRTGQRFANAPVPRGFLVVKVAASVQVVVSFDARSSITLGPGQGSPAACHTSRYLNAADCSRLARVQHDSSRRATAVEGAKLARVKSEDVFDWPVVVPQMCKMVRVHGARSSRGAAGESDLGSPHLTANPALGAEAQLCVVLVSRHCVPIMPASLCWMMKTHYFFSTGKGQDVE